MKSPLSWLRANLWRFPTNLRECEDWARHLWTDARGRFECWRLWYSPPWRSTRRCPACAGARRVVNSYTERDCEVCNGAGTVPKR